MSKKKILVIDDEAPFTRLMKLNLEKSGSYEVMEINKGLEGLTAAREYKPDLILLDIIMPDIAGGDLAAQIRSDKELSNTPIVFLTAIVSKAEASKEAFALGEFPLIAKPVDVEEVVELIEKHARARTKAQRI